jgi:hypothetical protein
MIPYRLAVFPNLTIRSCCDAAIQFKFARNYCLREITFADKIGDDADLANHFGIEQEQHIAQTRLLFPKSAFHIGKDFSTPNLRRMRERRRA